MGLVTTGRGDEGRQLVEDWVAKHPADASVRFQFASQLLQQSDNDAAIRENEALLKLFPNNPVLLNNLAWLYHRTGDARAVPTAEKAYQLAPEAGEVVDTLAWILHQQGQDDRSLTLLQEAVKKAPDLPEIAYHLAVVLEAKGRSAEARDVLRAALQTGKSFEGLTEARTLMAALEKK